MLHRQGHLSSIGWIMHTVQTSFLATLVALPLHSTSVSCWLGRVSSCVSSPLAMKIVDLKSIFRQLRWFHHQAGSIHTFLKQLICVKVFSGT